MTTTIDTVSHDGLKYTRTPARCLWHERRLMMHESVVFLLALYAAMHWFQVSAWVLNVYLVLLRLGCGTVWWQKGQNNSISSSIVLPTSRKLRWQYVCAVDVPVVITIFRPLDGMRFVPHEVWCCARE